MATGSITYYAGPTPPRDAVNPIQVSDVTPTDWTHVTRNLLEDARQILYFYNDAPAGDSTAPPTGDPVRWVGYVVSAVDGSFALFDDVGYGGVPDASALAGDFRVTYADGAVHAFNRDGLLTSITDRDGNVVSLDYTYDTTVAHSQKSYTLTTIHSPTDGTVDGTNTYDRELVITRATPTGFRDVTVQEHLGTTGAPLYGRSTSFKVATATIGSPMVAGIGDLVWVTPARRASACAGSGASGCARFAYSTNSSHLLSTVADPRWDQTTTGNASDYRFAIDWSTGDPTRITDLSHNGGSGADLLRVNAWDRTTSSLGARVAWQDGPAIVAGSVIHSDITADGRTLIEYVPLACSPSNCSSLPSDATISTQKRTANQFDGLSNVSVSTAFRTPSADPVISRQGTRAGAKVDNYINPLLGGQVAWSQTPEQLYASRVDSGNTHDDLYRTTYRYGDHGQQTHAITPAWNAQPDYPRAVKNATTTPTDLIGYYHLDEPSGTTAADDAGTAQNGTHANVTVNQSTTAIVNPGWTNKAASYNGSSSVTTLASFGTISGSYSVSAWLKPANDTTIMAFIGSRKGDQPTTDYTFDAKLVYDSTTKSRAIDVNVGDGSAWLALFRAPYDWRAGRWMAVGISVDDATDTIALYVDGELVGYRPFTTAGTPRLTDATRVLKIGNNGRDSITPQWFAGSIDEVAIWQGALERSQHKAVFLAGRSVTLIDVETRYSSSGHPTQVTDQFLANPAFEGGANAGWRTTSATFEQTTVHGGIGALNVATGGTAIQEVTLVPGQTFRVQGWDRTAASGTASYKVEYWKRSGTPAWTAFAGMPATFTGGSYAAHAWDLTLPADTDGRVRLTLANSAGSGTAYFDDIALFTTLAQTAYLTGGLPDTTTALSPAGTGTVLTKLTYGPTAAHPAIFATQVMVNDVASPSDPSEDLQTVTTYDTWGRSLTVTDPDGVMVTTTYQDAGDGAMTDVEKVTDDVGNETTMTYDTVGNRLTVETPLHEVSATTYDLRNHPLIETGPSPDFVKTGHTYDLAGQETAVIANYVEGTPSTGIDDVTTTYLRDAFGRVIRTDADDTVTDAVTTATYDVLGTTLTSTVYSGNKIGNPGFEAAATPTDWSVNAAWTIRTDGSATFVHSGQNSLRAVVPAGPVVSYGQTTARTRVTAGATYSGSAWVNGYATNSAGAAMTMRIRWYNPDGTYSDATVGSTVTVGSSQIWKLISGSLVAPVTAVEAMPFVQLSASTAGDVVWVDDTVFDEARTTTADFPPLTNGLSRARPTGTRLPIVPTSGGPACPSGTGMCNSVVALDPNGQPIASTDAYNNTTRTLLDLAGRPVLQITNYVDGVNNGSEVDTDLITTTTYRVSGQVDSVTGPSGRTATTAYDAVGRSTVVTAPSGLFQKPCTPRPGGPTAPRIRGAGHRRRRAHLDQVGLRCRRSPDQDHRPLRHQWAATASSPTTSKTATARGGRHRGLPDRRGHAYSRSSG